jgi:hypothetical protein
VIHSNYLRARQTWQAIAPVLPKALKVEESGDITPYGDPAFVASYLTALAAEHDNILMVSHLPLVVSGPESLPGGRGPHVRDVRAGLHRMARWQRSLALAGRTAYNTVKVNNKLQFGFLGKRESIFPVFYINLTELFRISCCHTDTTSRGCKR